MKKIIYLGVFSLVALISLGSLSPSLAHADTVVTIKFSNNTPCNVVMGYLNLGGLNSSTSNYTCVTTPPVVVPPVNPGPVHTITVLSPNGGERFGVSSPVTVRWSMNYNSNSVVIRLTSPVSNYYYASSPISGSSGNQNQYTIPVSVTNTANSAGSQYRVEVCDNNQSASGLPGSLCDQSDNSFSIGSSQITPPPTTVGQMSTGSMSCSIVSYGQTRNSIFIFRGSPAGGVAPYNYSLVYNRSGSMTSTPVSVPGTYGVGTMYNQSSGGSYLTVNSLNGQSSRVVCQ